MPARRAGYYCERLTRPFGGVHLAIVLAHPPNLVVPVPSIVAHAAFPYDHARLEARMGRHAGHVALLPCCASPRLASMALAAPVHKSICWSRGWLEPKPCVFGCMGYNTPMPPEPNLLPALPCSATSACKWHESLLACFERSVLLLLLLSRIMHACFALL